MRPVQGKLRQVVKPLYSGVSWQSPVARAMMPVLDRVEARVRRGRDLGHLPPYSARIRSTGMDGEFGGTKFVLGGKHLQDNLVQHAGLQPTDTVLDIGCGAARLGTALVDLVDGGHYVGFDIDRVAIDACRVAPRLARFEFVHADIANAMYRADGSLSAATYRFPFGDESFDLIFLESVFTHMLEADCANYAREIRRMLRPDGRAVVSTYLHGGGPWANPAFQFQHRVGSAYIEYEEAPLKVVSYEPATFEAWFGRPVRTLHGGWRREGETTVDEWQDWVIVTSPAGP